MEGGSTTRPAEPTLSKSRMIVPLTTHISHHDMLHITHVETHTLPSHTHRRTWTSTLLLNVRATRRPALARNDDRLCTPTIAVSDDDAQTDEGTRPSHTTPRHARRSRTAPRPRSSRPTLSKPFSLSLEPLAHNRGPHTLSQVASARGGRTEATPTPCWARTAGHGPRAQKSTTMR